MIRAIEKGILAQLSAAAAITAIVGARLYATQPPAEAALPYVLVAVNSGGSTNDTPRDALDVTVMVQCVATDTPTASGASTAKQVADLVRAALHNAALTLDAPWGAFDCEHLDVFVYSENEDRVQYTYAGGLYRVRATT